MRKATVAIFAYQQLAEDWEDITDAIAEEATKAPKDDDKDRDDEQVDEALAACNVLAMNKEKEIETVREADIPPLVAMLMSHESLKDMDEEKRLCWATLAVRTVDNCIELFEEPESQSQLQ